MSHYSVLSPSISYAVSSEGPAAPVCIVRQEYTGSMELSFFVGIANKYRRCAVTKVQLIKADDPALEIERVVGETIAVLADEFEEAGEMQLAEYCRGTRFNVSKWSTYPYKIGV